ncbi:leucine-rich repeat-containing protein 2 isoform X1 [Cynoglossus semilaevis]|nr:leucine-rich repeat-containing protein 2 isoform X1 [Cynoglossus semilaevis]XP_016898758.1 leucine-rich repeat-containing protein 2 isoform X1 [Cynoglossus semilaevis]XP_024908990.1 leucine-rich repeat-containing protein 2 isoform X1 [Cynoglossus semilaevis]
MGVERKLDAPVYDLSMVRGLWEGRVKKYKQRQRREQERIEKSALARIDQEWQYRIYCKTLKSTEREFLHRHLRRSQLSDKQFHDSGHSPGGVIAETGTGPDQDQDHRDPEGPNPHEEPDPGKLSLRMEGQQWTDFPRELQWMTYLKEWHVSRTRIQKLPDYLALFTQLTVMDVPKNAIAELPPEIGKLTELRELNVSYNQLSKVPPELGNCEKLEKLELAGNRSLSELPFELRNLQLLTHLDIAENRFMSIPICALRMSSLQLLDLSNNCLTDLPQDMDRLEQLVTLFVHKNQLTYLPMCLTNISTLKMIIVSGDELTCTPTKLCSNPEIKFVRLCDNALKKKKKEEKKKKEKTRKWRWRTPEEQQEVKDGREKEFIEAYVNTLKDRDTVPYSTTTVSISCQL